MFFTYRDWGQCTQSGILSSGHTVEITVLDCVSHEQLRVTSGHNWGSMKLLQLPNMTCTTQLEVCEHCQQVYSCNSSAICWQMSAVLCSMTNIVHYFKDPPVQTRTYVYAH